MEAWVRGLYQKFAKFPYSYFCTVGSNPTASANNIYFSSKSEAKPKVSAAITNLDIDY